MLAKIAKTSQKTCICACQYTEMARTSLWGRRQIRLYFPLCPVAPVHVQAAKQEDEGGVDHLRRPAQRHVEAQEEDDVGDVGHVDNQHRQFQAEGGACVARARNRLEVDVGRYQQQVGGTHHPQRGDGGLSQVGHVGIDAEYPVGEETEQCGQGQNQQVGQADVLADGGAHAVGMPRPDEVTHQRAASGGEGHHHHEQDAADASDDVGHGQRAFTQVFDVEEKQEPGGQGDGILYHGPQRHVEHTP